MQPDTGFLLADVAPAPWGSHPPLPVAGLLDVGFSPEHSLLLVVGWGGRTVLDPRMGEVLAQDPCEPDRSWHDPWWLEALGIGPLAGQIVRLAGTHGGGLPRTTSDGWSLVVEHPDPKTSAIVLRQPPHPTALPRRASDMDPTWCTHLGSTDDLRVVGFSAAGDALVVGTGSRLHIWYRHDAPRPYRRF